MATQESVLQQIDKDFVSLNRDEEKYVNSHFTKVMEKLIARMQFKNSLFNDIYQHLFFAGSFYDSLKIGKPDEFDVDIVVDLPIDYSEMSFKSKKVTPGFIKIQASKFDELLQDTKKRQIYKQMKEWTDGEGFLLQSKFRNWMLKVVEDALKSLDQHRGNAQLQIDEHSYQILLRPNGPAITLNVTLPDGAVFDVDLVPVLKFKHPEHWPPQVRKNPFTGIESWFIVPKSNSKNQKEFRDTFWRLAFHEQEREIIRDRGQLKPACRLIKKLRDCHGFHKICSYYIKTIFLWMVDEKNEIDPNYWKTVSLSQLFLEALKTLSSHLAETKIDYYWNSKNNLLAGSDMTIVEQENTSTSLKKIIGDIEKNMIKNPSIFAKHLLTPEEFGQFNNGWMKANLQPAITVGVNAIQVLPKGSRQDQSFFALQHEFAELKTNFELCQQENANIVTGLEVLISQLKTENEDLRGVIERQQSGLGYLFSRARLNSSFW